MGKGYTKQQYENYCDTVNEFGKTFGGNKGGQFSYLKQNEAFFRNEIGNELYGELIKSTSKSCAKLYNNPQYLAGDVGDSDCYLHLINTRFNLDGHDQQKTADHHGAEEYIKTLRESGISSDMLNEIENRIETQNEINAINYLNEKYAQEPYFNEPDEYGNGGDE